VYQPTEAGRGEDAWLGTGWGRICTFARVHGDRNLPPVNRKGKCDELWHYAFFSKKTFGGSKAFSLSLRIEKMC
jgi:hypothetical protein